MSDIDVISINCPHCGTTAVKTFPWAMTHFTTRCTNCRKAYLIDRAYLLRNLQRLDGGLKAGSASARD